MLSEMVFWRVTELPRVEASTTERDDVTPARLEVGLIGAYHERESVAVAWIRPDVRQPLEILVGGNKSIGSRASSEATEKAGCLIYPSGAYGQKKEAGAAIKSLRRFPCWLRCDVVASSHPHEHAAEHDQSKPSVVETAFEDYVVHLAHIPLTWLVVGIPVTQVDITAEMRAIEAKVTELQSKKESRPQYRIELERSERRLHEIVQAQWTGLWDVHVLVGAEGDNEVQLVAALLSAGMTIANGQYAVRPGATSGPLDQVLPARGTGHAASSLRVPSDVLASIARLPRRELPGIRLVTPHTFDVTQEVPLPLAQPGILSLGAVMDASLNEVGTLKVSYGTLNRHTFVCGATGSGKSQTVRALLETLSCPIEPNESIPWLVIEPTKAEYRGMAGRLEGRGEVLVIRPGDKDAVPASLNPLEPEPNFPLQTHIDLVRALFLAAFEADEPFPQVLSYALTGCYQNLGWDLALGESKLRPVVPKYPNLSDLQNTAKKVVESIGYGKEVTDNVRGFIDVRIGSLRLGAPGRFFEGGHPVDIGALLRRNVVIELEDIGNDQDKAFLIGTVLIRLYEHLRMQHEREMQDRRMRGESVERERLRHVTVVEEAHRLLKNVIEGSPAAHAVELFAALLAEIRVYGEGIIVAEQIPVKILPDVIKNTALKIVHRLPAQDDRVHVGATMNLDDEQSRYVVTLTPGMAAVFTDGMDRPLLVRMPPAGEARESTKRVVREVPLVRVRSAACSLDCRIEQPQRPCTLREMAEAAQLAENPQVTLWIEMIVVAHLTGMWLPTPQRSWLTEMVTYHQSRTLECAIGQCVQAAIDVRYPELLWPLLSQPEARRKHLAAYTPEKLAAHVRDVALCQIGSRDNPCTPDEVGFQSGPYRWNDVRGYLQIAEKDGSTVPHHTIERWKERGIFLVGTRPSDQLASLKRQPAYLRPKDAVIHGLIWPSRIEQAVERLSNASDWTDHLREALAFLDFGSDNWSQYYVTENTLGKLPKGTS